MPHFDIITIGSATQDVYLFGKALRVKRDATSPTGSTLAVPFGAKIELDRMLVEVGGGGTNTAVTFSRLGLRTACVVKVGNDAAGDHVIRILREHKVSSRFVIRDHDDPTAMSTFFLAPNGERTVFVFRGASADFHERMVPWADLAARWYYVSSVGGELNFIRRAIAHAKKTHAHIAVNPGKRELQQRSAAMRVLRDADVLLVNQEEAQLFFQKKGHALVKAISAWRKGIVVVTNAEKGSWAVTERGMWQVRIKPVKAVDTTGAGDAFGSGFVAGLAKRPGDIAYALRLGSINGASVVTQLGAKHGLITHHIPHGPWMRVVEPK
ncbi:MAG: carbohydrate kinase family protein [Patescibacteria group bacterium]|jgi:ribokinase